MSIFSELVNLLPPEQDLLLNLSTIISGDEILRRNFNELIRLKQNTTNDGEKTNENIRNSLKMLNVLIDFLHENLHMGEWHSVDVKLRRSYSVACFFKVRLHN